MLSTVVIDLVLFQRYLSNIDQFLGFMLVISGASSGFGLIIAVFFDTLEYPTVA